MSGWPFLLAALAFAAGATLLARPAWDAYRSRRRRDLNAERYLAWRGRADRNPAAMSMTEGERRRLWAAALLASIAVVSLLLFLGAR